jgi:hypothetical protein
VLSRRWYACDGWTLSKRKPVWVAVCLFKGVLENLVQWIPVDCFSPSLLA